MTSIFRYTLLSAFAGLFLTAATGRAADVDDATEKAMKNALAVVAPTIVKIETAGGAEVVGERGQGGGVRKGTGPTTGLIVDPDGYIITSSFNFVNKPTDIFVTLPGHPKRLVAKVVANDLTRMLTLLKVDAHNLPVPRPFNKSEVEVGMWSLALGRTQDPEIDHPPSMSIGIVSAVNRIWGKAIQTDAKTSPVNYGGPLIAIDARVLGVIVPASSRSDGETAGVDFYDSGIGFAIPLDDVLAVLPRLKEGKDLRRGLLGVVLKNTDKYTSAATIGTVQPTSAAAKAGVKPGDTILEINGKAIPNFSTLQHVLGPMYEGDVVALKIKRDDKEMAIKNVKLQGTETAEVNAFLGVLPIRDDPGPGVEIRYVYPNSPADSAGLKMGDRVMKLAPASVPALSPVQNRAALTEMIESLAAGAEVKIEVKRKDGGKVETVTLKLTAAPSELPEKLPLPSSAEKALETVPKKKDAKDFLPKGKGEAPEEEGSLNCGDDKKQEPKKDEPKKDDLKKEEQPKIETGYLKRTNEALGRDYWLYVPESYNPNVSHGLIVWFHDIAQRGKDGEVMARTFKEVCENYHFIMIGPRSNNATGWLPSETELVVQDVRTVIGDYTIDKSRVVAHGMGNGGQMSYYLGFNARDVFRGVAVLGAVLGTNPKENIAKQPLSFFIAAGDKDPLLKDIVENTKVLQEKRFPVIFREMKESGKEYYDEGVFRDMVMWLDSLDRI